MFEVAWPRGALDAGRGPRALEAAASCESVLNGPSDMVQKQIADGVDEMINAVAAAYGVL